MTRDEARAALARLRTFCLAADPAGAERAQCLHDLAAFEGLLAHPGPLLTDDEVYDETIRRGGDLLIDSLDQLEEGAIDAYLAERRAQRERNRRARLHEGDAHCLDSAIPDPAEGP